MDVDKATCTHMSAQFIAKTKAIEEKIEALISDYEMERNRIENENR